jgi:plasmid stabilization system protein ParE
MNWRIKWSAGAVIDRQQIRLQIYEASRDKHLATRFVKDLSLKTEAALSNGLATYRIGKIKDTYEYVVHKNYIAVYREHSKEYPKDKYIEILALWDVRQNPKRLSLTTSP